MIYCEQPVFAVLAFLLLFWQIVLCWLTKKTQVRPLIHTVLTGVGLVGHAVTISVILLYGGTLSDVLLLVLASGAVALFLSPTPNKTADKTQEEKL